MDAYNCQDWLLKWWTELREKNNQVSTQQSHLNGYMLDLEYVICRYIKLDFNFVCVLKVQFIKLSGLPGDFIKNYYG